MKTRTASGAAWLEGVRPEVEAALEAALERSSLRSAPPLLRAAVRRALFPGGKRLRPALALLSCEALGGERRRGMPGAVACELVHAYSLVHDDLPGLDDDELRRGQPALHVAFGEAVAILAGDALQTLAFEVLAAQDDAELARDQSRILSAAAGPSGMVGGQVLDVLSEGLECGQGEVEAIHAGKTAALLRAALQVGARAAGGDPGPWDAYGTALGRLFQATDDLLDATATGAELGKSAGRDLVLDKATLVRSLGLEGARRRAAALAAAARQAAAALPLCACREVVEDLPALLLSRTR